MKSICRPNPYLGLAIELRKTCGIFLSDIIIPFLEFGSVQKTGSSWITWSGGHLSQLSQPTLLYIGEIRVRKCVLSLHVALLQFVYRGINRNHDTEEGQLDPA